MKKELINELFNQFEQAAYNHNGIECWSGRELQEVFHYSEWRNFLKVIEKARISCEAAGVAASDHFVELNKMIDLAKGTQREIRKPETIFPIAGKWLTIYFLTLHFQ